MQWHDGHLSPAVEDQDYRRNSPTSQPRRRRSFGYDHDDRRNGNASSVVMEGLGFGGSSARPGDIGDGVSGRTLAGEGNFFGGGGAGGCGGDGDEDDDTAVLRVLEQVLAKHYAKQNRRPSTAVRRILIL